MAQVAISGEYDHLSTGIDAQRPHSAVYSTCRGESIQHKQPGERQRTTNLFGGRARGLPACCSTPPLRTLGLRSQPPLVVSTSRVGTLGCSFSYGGGSPDDARRGHQHVAGRVLCTL